MQIFLKPNEAQSYFTTSWILFQRECSLVFLCGKLVIFELWGDSIASATTVTVKVAYFLFLVISVR